jgi:hypothetical protein
MQNSETASPPLEVGNPNCTGAFAGGPQPRANLTSESFAGLPGSQGIIDAVPERSSADTYVLEALTEALQIAFDAAIFHNRFEIDEQGPVSRIDALTERLIDGIENFSTIHGSPDVAKAASISIIDKISKHIRASI